VFWHFFFFTMLISRLVYSFDSVLKDKPDFFSSHQAVLFSGTSNSELAVEVAKYLSCDLGKAVVSTFNDGEVQIRIDENVRNKEVFILQSTCTTCDSSVNDHLMELLLLARTLKRSSAKSITAVIPYYGYARQDRKNISRVPISASDIAFLLETSGIDRVVTVDLHCGQIQGFFHHSPVDNLSAETLFVPYFIQKNLRNVVVVAPDAGAVERARQFAKNLMRQGVASNMAIISKYRAQAGVVESMQLIGDVVDADVILVDDLCDTGGTLVCAAELLKTMGAKHVYAAITHPVFSGNALEKIKTSVIDEMVISNTIGLRKPIPNNVTCISIAPLLGESIARILLGESVSALFLK